MKLFHCMACCRARGEVRPEQSKISDKNGERSLSQAATEGTATNCPVEEAKGAADRDSQSVEAMTVPKKQQLFQEFDKDGDGFLNKVELRVFAERIGFDGSADEWTEGYEQMCSEYNLEPKKGVTLGVFMKMLDDAPEQDVCQLLGTEATDLEAYTGINSLRKLIGSGDVILIKASYILQLKASRTPMPRRQDLPPHAVVGEEMLERLLAELHTKSRKKSDTTFSGVVITSHAWGCPEHPDKHCEQLVQVLAPSVEWYMSERARRIQTCIEMGPASRVVCPSFSGKELTSENIDFGLFFDYPCMYQKPRSDSQDAAFRRALGSMDVLYAHQQTVKWRLTRQMPRATGLDYCGRGWPFFETSCCHLISWDVNILDMGRADFTKPLHGVLFKGEPKPADELAAQGTWSNWKDKGVLSVLLDPREPPLVPEAFRQQVAEKKFTNNADVGDVIALQDRVARAVFAGVERLRFEAVHWREKPGVALTSALRMCSSLKALTVIKAPFGDEGTAAIAEFLAEGALPRLEELSLQLVGMGDQGLRALCAALAKGGQQGLRKLFLYCNSYTSTTPLAEMLGQPGAVPALAELGAMKVEGDDQLQAAAEVRDSSRRQLAEGFFNLLLH